MTLSLFWWLLAGIAIVAELLTGSFYLLMVALGLAAGAVTAYLGFTLFWQITCAAIVGSGAVFFWHRYRDNQPRQLHANANPDVNLDIGETVHVDAWQEDGTTAIKYRGALWTAARHPTSLSPQGATGLHRIVEVVGNRLILEKI